MDRTICGICGHHFYSPIDNGLCIRCKNEQERILRIAQEDTRDEVAEPCLC